MHSLQDMSDVPTVTQDDLAAGLDRLGLRAGDGVMVHSSLKSFGHVIGGPETVIRALMSAVGQAGCVMMPSFNHGHCVAPGQPGYYDPLTTPTSNGAIPDRFWRMPGVCRSLAPSHPFAAWGRHAAAHTRWHHRTLTCGADSPLGLLAGDGGWGLLLGVTFNSNTYHHVVETMLGVPCLGQRTEAIPVKLPGGRMVDGRTWTWRQRGCPLNDSGTYPRIMGDRGMLRRTTIGASQVTLFRLRDCHEAAAQVFREGVGDIPPCSRCPIRPQPTEHTVESDWDFERQCLRQDSPARQY